MILWLFVAYAVVIVFITAWGALIGLRFKDTLTPHPLPPQPPSISCVVPARNEERNIGRCLEGLSAQNYPAFEIVVVDDDSSDDTPAILSRWQARDNRIRVVHTGGKPPGWNGKQNACYKGAQAASNDWLCFMDADTYAEPSLLRQTMAFALANNIDMLTMQPWYVMGSFWERTVLPSALSGILYIFPPHKVNDPAHPMAIANGQFIMMPRAVYEAIGGHEAVRDRMMDDFPLAEHVKGLGYRLYMVDGSQVMRVRLYHNLGEIWAGALKTAVDITGGWRITIMAVLINLFTHVGSIALLAWAIVLGSVPIIAISAGTAALWAVYNAMVCVQGFRVPAPYGLLYPLAGVISSAILLDGMARLLTGRSVRWKDRELMGTPGVSAPNVLKRIRDR